MATLRREPGAHGRVLREGQHGSQGRASLLHVDPLYLTATRALNACGSLLMNYLLYETLMGLQT